MPEVVPPAPDRPAAPLVDAAPDGAPFRDGSPGRTAPAALSGPTPTTAQTAAVVAAAGSVRRRLGVSDLDVFPVALSGNVFGWTADGPTVDAILDRYRDHGGNFIDTADCYAAGRSEIMVGNWMRSRGVRDRMVVATKIGKSTENPGLSAAAVARSVESSLRRLRTDRIDLLYLHVDDDSVPFEETLLAVDRLIRAGAVRYLGGADHTAERLTAARVACGQVGVAPMLALQNQYSLMHRAEYERGLATVARQQGLAVMPRYALAGGFLSGKYRDKASLAATDHGAESLRHFTRRGLRVLAVLDRVAAELGSAPATVALAWLLSKPLVCAPVVSASSADQVFDLTAAAALTLTRHQLAELDRASAN